MKPNGKSPITSDDEEKFILHRLIAITCFIHHRSCQ
ncbi:unnamed protein product, partial [Brassica rapa subsp. narinosa]